MASKFDEYLKKGNFTSQEKSAMAEAGKTREDIKENPKSAISVARKDKVSTEPGKLNEGTSERVESTQKGKGNNHEIQSGDSKTLNENVKNQAGQIGSSKSGLKEGTPLNKDNPKPQLKELETHGQQRKNTLAKYQSGKSSTHPPGKKLAISGEKKTALGAHAKNKPTSNTQQPQTDVSKSSSPQKPIGNQQTQSHNNSAIAKKDSLATYKADQKIPNSKGNDRMPGGMNQGSMSNKYPANKGVSKSSSTPLPSKGPDKGQGR